MKSFEAEKVFYKVQSKLGTGLTSEVYKAVRTDSHGLTAQPVALKIIKSRKDVQVLKAEFESLLRVDSKFCVKILAWEQLNPGPALVLEYIDGVTLHRLSESATLSSEVVSEIMVQIKMGLRALHQKQVFHGDLNLKNVMISKEGVVKLIDFGFQGRSCEEQLLTPKFASPERLSGQRPSNSSDQYSMQAIESYLCERHGCRQPFSQPRSSSRAKMRRVLAAMVGDISKQQTPETIAVKTEKKPRTRKALSWLLSVAAFLLCFFRPGSQAQPNFYDLEMRSSHWFEVSINGLPGEFAPLIGRRLRTGEYNVVLNSQAGRRELNVQIPRDLTKLLQLADKKL